MRVFLRIPPPRTVYFTKEAIYDDAREIKLGEGEANGGRRLEGSKFYLGSEQVATGSTLVFVFQMLAWKMGCRLDFYVNIRGDSGGSAVVPVQCGPARSVYICVHVYIPQHFRNLRTKFSLCACLYMHMLVLISCVGAHVYTCVQTPSGGGPGPSHSAGRGALSQCITVVADVSSGLSPGSRYQPIETHSAAASGTLRDEPGQWPQ